MKLTFGRCCDLGADEVENGEDVASRNLKMKVGGEEGGRVGDRNWD